MISSSRFRPLPISTQVRSDFDPGPKCFRPRSEVISTSRSELILKFDLGDSQFRPGRFSISTWSISISTSRPELDLNFIIQARIEFRFHPGGSQFHPPGPNWIPISTSRSELIGFSISTSRSELKLNFNLQVRSDFDPGPK